MFEFFSLLSLSLSSSWLLYVFAPVTGSVTPMGTLRGVNAVRNLNSEAGDACESPLTQAALIKCVVARSPVLQADAEQIAVARGEAEAARLILPSNPSANLSLSHRSNPIGNEAFNISGSVSQSIEIGGQRRQRVHRSQAMVEGATSQHRLTERELIAAALMAYYDVLAARGELEVIKQVVRTSERLHEVAVARSKAGLASALDAELAAVDRSLLLEKLALAQGKQNIALARVADALGLDPILNLPILQGELEPLPRSPKSLKNATNIDTRPEMQFAQANRRIEEAQLRLLKRSRAPNPTISLFAQKDGFNERVFGAGLSFPIPLPSPLGHTNKGQIEAAYAGIRAAKQRISAVQRRLGLEFAVALNEYEAREAARAAYDEAGQRRARQALEDLKSEIELGRLPIRDALLAQQALLNRLVRALESAHQLCRASVTLRLATGNSFLTEK